jgi:RNA polymerase sigma-70 factor (ECF subfamily)
VTFAAVFPFAPLWATAIVAAPEAPGEDATLVRRILSEDRGAFDLLVARYQRVIFAIGYRMTGSAADAEDLCQDVLLRVFRSLDRFDTARPLGPWIRKIACNASLHFLRHRGVERRLVRDRVDDGGGAGGADGTDPGLAVADGRPGPEEIAAARDLDRRLQQALLAFPEKPRLAFTLKYVEGLTSAEIAEALEVPRDTVKTWLLRARERLRRDLSNAM